MAAGSKTTSLASPPARVTVSHIADHLGVSLPAVRAVLTGRAGNTRVSKQLAARVRQAAAGMGYHVNAAARATVTGKFNTVSLLLSTESVRSIVPEGLIDGVHDALAERDYHLTLSKVSDERLTTDSFVPRILSELMCDGLLINYNMALPEKLVTLVRNIGLPAIWINSKQQRDCVYLDDFGAGVAAAKLAVALGHARIAFANLCGEGHYSATDRRDGYLSVMQEHGLTPMLLSKFDLPIPERVVLAKRWLMSGDRPTAVIGYTGHEAQAFCRAAELLGLELSRDLSIIALGVGQSAYIERQVDSVCVNEREVGIKAVGALMQRLDGAGAVAPIVIPFAHVQGSTLGPPKA